MRIAVMGRSIRPGASGVGRYAEGLVRALPQAIAPGEVTAFVTRDAPPLGGSVRTIVAPAPTPNEYARMAWEQTIVPVQVRARGFDVYHSPNYVLPLALGCRSVVTVHDVTFRTRRGEHKSRSAWYLVMFTSIAARRAGRLICVSEHTRSEFARLYPHAADRTTVVYQGITPGLARPTDVALSAWRARRGIGAPYVLYVGTLEPRKNIPTLIRAFEAAVRSRALPHHLVICGGVGWNATSILEAAESSPLRERIHLAGYVPDEELPYWYGGASLVAYLSKEEGFGLPPLEAMACGTPVLCSDIPSLREACGDAAHRVDPAHHDAVTSAMARLLRDDEYATELAGRGLAQAARFTWAAAAQQLRGVYEDVLRGGARPVRAPEGQA